MLSKKLTDARKWLVIALGVAIPTSTSLNSILLALIIPLWLISRDYKNTLVVIKKNKYIWSIFILVGLYFIGLFYGEADIKDAGDEFFAVASLLLIPVMNPFFSDEKTRNSALNLFLATMTVLLLFSYLIWFGIMPGNTIFEGTQKEPILFLARTKHGLLMALSAFIFAVRARQCENWKTRMLFIILIMLFVFNVTVMVGGKTGYLVLITLTAYYFLNWLRWKGIVFAVLAIILFGTFTYLHPQSGMHKRLKEFYIDMTDKSIWDWHSEEYKNTSTGLRMMFYKNSLKIIIDDPITGVGTGGYKKAYSKVVQGTKMPAVDNPHSHYLRVTSELGLLGLCSFLLLFFIQWRLAADLHSKYDTLLARGLILTILSISLVASALNSHLTRTLYIWMSALLFGGYINHYLNGAVNDSINKDKK